MWSKGPVSHKVIQTKHRSTQTTTTEYFPGGRGQLQFYTTQEY